MVDRAACITCDFSLITILDDVVGVAHSSSDESLEPEDDDEDESSSPCSAESYKRYLEDIYSQRYRFACVYGLGDF